MSDNIPFEIQVEIVKRLPVKSLMQFRSVSKTWKSLIDSSQFVTGHYGQQTPLRHLFVNYKYFDKQMFVSYVDDDTFPERKVSGSLPLQLRGCEIIGCSHGLLCLYGGNHRLDVAYLWNISIRKGIVVPILPILNVGDGYECVLGFGVCGTDPKIVKITQSLNPESMTVIPWRVEVFTLSARAWRRPYNKLPRNSIYFDFSKPSKDSHVGTNEFLYWLAFDRVTNDTGSVSWLNLIISFDMTSEEFKEVNLPSNLAHVTQSYNLSLFKQSESLVVLESTYDLDDEVYDVWIMEDDATNLFKKHYTIKSSIPGSLVKGYRMNGAPIVELPDDDDRDVKQLIVYEPYTKQIIDLVVDGEHYSSCVYAYYYMETLLLHDQPNMGFNHI